MIDRHIKADIISKGVYIWKKSMVLRTLLILNGQKKEMKRRKTRQPKSKREKRRFFFFKSFRSLFRCVEWTMWALYFHRVWKQVIYILDLVQNYLKLSTKIYHT